MTKIIPECRNVIPMTYASAPLPGGLSVNPAIRKTSSYRTITENNCSQQKGKNLFIMRRILKNNVLIDSFERIPINPCKLSNDYLGHRGPGRQVVDDARSLWSLRRPLPPGSRLSSPGRGREGLPLPLKVVFNMVNAHDSKTGKQGQISVMTPILALKRANREHQKKKQAFLAELEGA